jgi:hypothetical protein
MNAARAYATLGGKLQKPSFAKPERVRNPLRSRDPAARKHHVKQSTTAKKLANAEKATKKAAKRAEAKKWAAMKRAARKEAAMRNQGKTK